MTWNTDEHEDHAIVRYEGRPNEGDRAAERTRWQRFLEFVHLSSYKTQELGEAYARAAVAKEENKAARIGAHAAEIATRADLNRAKEVKIVNEEIRRIFSTEDVPVQAVEMQLKMLASRYPEIFEQWERIDQIREDLRLKRGTLVQIVEDEPAATGEPPARTVRE